MEKVLKKWDFDRHCYEDVPNSYGVELNPLGRTRCANCGISITVGTSDCKTSIQLFKLHSHCQLGYHVCDYCFQMELILKERAGENDGK